NIYEISPELDRVIRPLIQRKIRRCNDKIREYSRNNPHDRRGEVQELSDYGNFNDLNFNFSNGGGTIRVDLGSQHRAFRFFLPRNNHEKSNFWIAIRKEVFTNEEVNERGRIEDVETTSFFPIWEAERMVSSNLQDLLNRIRQTGDTGNNQNPPNPLPGGNNNHPPTPTNQSLTFTIRNTEPYFADDCFKLELNPPITVNGNQITSVIIKGDQVNTCLENGDLAAGNTLTITNIQFGPSLATIDNHNTLAIFEHFGNIQAVNVNNNPVPNNPPPIPRPTFPEVQQKNQELASEENNLLILAAELLKTIEENRKVVHEAQSLGLNLAEISDDALDYFQEEFFTELDESLAVDNPTNRQILATNEQIRHRKLNIKENINLIYNSNQQNLAAEKNGKKPLPTDELGQLKKQVIAEINQILTDKDNLKNIDLNTLESGKYQNWEKDIAGLASHDQVIAYKNALLETLKKVGIKANEEENNKTSSPSSPSTPQDNQKNNNDSVDTNEIINAPSLAVARNIAKKKIRELFTKYEKLDDKQKISEFVQALERAMKKLSVKSSPEESNNGLPRPAKIAIGVGATVENEDIFALKKELKKANAFIFCHQDEYKPLSILHQFNKENADIKRFHGGIYEQKLISNELLEKWANLPSKEYMNEKQSSKEINEIVEKIDQLNLGKISELVDKIKEKYNIKEDAVIQSTGSAPTSEKVEEKGGNVSLKLLGIKETVNKIKIYGIIKDSVKQLKGEDINIIQAKKIMEKEDKVIFTDIPRDKAEGVKKQLENEGRRQYLTLNNSPLFQTLPQRDFAHEQKSSYYDFLDRRLNELLNFYFPFNCSDHNNTIELNIEKFHHQEPKISQEEAQLKEDISDWVEKSFNIEIEIKEKNDNHLVVSFHYQQEKEILFCHLPKINSQGNFIINGHDKVVVFQFATSTQHPKTIELKFPNSVLVINFLDLLKTWEVPAETLEILFNRADLDISNYSSAKSLEAGVNLPKFLFTKKNSYFDFVIGQVLAENVCDVKSQVVLSKNTILTEKNLQVLRRALAQKKISTISLPGSNNELYCLKINSPHNKEEVITIVGIVEEISEEKTYFDLSDLVCSIAFYLNLPHGLGKTEREEDKDKLENQVIRRVGDLIYNIFNNKLGGFLQDINSKYLANISQLKKADLTKIPNLKDFDNLLKDFFNTSALVQLQNQNNPLSEISYARKLSVLGLGGFSSANTTLAARNINSSYYGRYDLVETPEGQRVGLIHNLAMGTEINDYGQAITPYYSVEKGIISSQLVYLASEEESDKYIAHCNIRIDKKNRILDEVVAARYQGNLVQVPTEKINYIDSSFYQLNSITSAIIPFFHHNDATRMLMATNMQRQAVTLLKSQEPLIASGVEASLNENSSLLIRAEEKGQVDYVDSCQIVIKETGKDKKTYNLSQLAISNKNLLNFSFPLVKKGEKVGKGQIIASGNYANNGELSLGYNLRHLIIRRNTKYGEEKFVSSLPYAEKNQFPHLDKDGIVKVGSEVKENDILVGKITPEPGLRQETEEELLLLSILGEKAQRFVDSSLYLPTGEKGTVYDVKRKKLSRNKKELEVVEIYISQARKIEVGDKLTTRFGNKGVVAKIVPEIDMPFDDEGKTIDIIFNPLGIPTRMNIGQLLETILAAAAFKLNSKFLIRPFDTPSLETIKEIIHEAEIKNFGAQKLFDGQTGLPFHQNIYTGYIYTVKLNHMVFDKIHARNTGPYSLIYQQPLKGRSQGGALEAHGAAYNLMEMMSAKSDDIYKRRLMQNNLLFDKRQIELRNSQSESFNLLLQYLRGIGGLFDPRVFVLIAEKNIQRWRMGHITLNTPVTNILLFKSLAANLSKLLEIPAKKLEDIIYFRAYTVADNGLTNLLKKKDILEKEIDLSLMNSILQEIITDQENLKKVAKKYKEEEKKIVKQAQELAADYLDFVEKYRHIKIKTGSEAFEELLKGIDLVQELEKAKSDSKPDTKTNQEKIKFLTKLKEEDTVVTTQINNLQRKYEKKVFFGEIIHNVKRRLQKSVDQLLQGSPRVQNETKSLLQNLSGKEGILRRYSLGKRVDYSARSVIVPNPNLLLTQIGLPVQMALVLYKPFIIQQILKEKIVFTVKEADQLLIKKDPIIFSLLDKIIANHPVLANRAPSLHRLSIQGFYPRLTLGKAIELHPLITSALNADFDGDQIAIYLPLTKSTCKEVKESVLSSHNLVDPKNGHLIDMPSQDMILGIYYLTQEKKETTPKFYDEIGTSFPYYLNNLEIYNQTEEEYKEATVEINEVEKIKITPHEEMVKFLDNLKEISFRYATYSGISISPFELGEVVVKRKELARAEQKIKEIDNYYSQGFYKECKDNLQEQLISNLAKKSNTSIYHIWDSGARASSENLTQIFAMRGNTTNYLGEIIETPIISSLWEGLTPFEFFTSVYGAVKGMVDIALKTAEAGYLTRRLVESTQGIIVNSPDCGTNSGVLVEENDSNVLVTKIYGLRSTLTCELVSGVCQKCYGLDLSKPSEQIAMGTAVGIIAAQSLGEPGTQLTMRTFHAGGIAGDEDIIQGLPKVKQIFDNIKPEKKEKAILAKCNGTISSVEEEVIKQKSEKGEEIIYSYEPEKKVRVKKGEKVILGTRLTSGKIDLEEYLEIVGRERCQKYIKEGIKLVYDNQGIDIDDKHIEIFARQMLSRVEIIESDNDDYLLGDIVDYQTIQKTNELLIKAKKKPILFKNIISSLKDLASSPPSFLAGISFQNTLKSLVNYSLYQPVDYLQGVKENLIAGQLVPIGTGFKEREKYLEGRKTAGRKKLEKNNL
ncbi:2876_t:CDS:10, partial [Entrophospora sp. SA101]